MLWIGITGSMGSGKSSVAKILKDKGYPVMDADQVVSQILQSGGSVEALVIKTFGQAVQGADGKLDRRALGRIVFTDKQKLQQLEGILHPLVKTVVSGEREKFRNSGYPVAFYDVPLLFEKDMSGQFDYILVVTAARELCIQRIEKRTGLSRSEIEARLNSQLDPAFKIGRASAVIYNDGGFNELRDEVEGALRNLHLPLPAPI